MSRYLTILLAIGTAAHGACSESAPSAPPRDIAPHDAAETDTPTTADVVITDGGADTHEHMGDAADGDAADGDGDASATVDVESPGDAVDPDVDVEDAAASDTDADDATTDAPTGDTVASLDAVEDASLDAVEDASPDAVEDASLDAVEDASLDAVEDASPDAVEDTGGDAPGPDASAPDVFDCGACDDGDPCTLDLCDAGACAHLPAAGESCDDGDACTADDTCDLDGICAGAPVIGCVPCTGATACDDGDTCTSDTCVDGACVNLPADWSDGVFVASSGDDANPGTTAAPKATVGAGVAAAQALGLSRVYLQGGVVYEGPIGPPKTAPRFDAEVIIIGGFQGCGFDEGSPALAGASILRGPAGLPLTIRRAHVTLREVTLDPVQPGVTSLLADEAVVDIDSSVTVEPAACMDCATLELIQSTVQLGDLDVRTRPDCQTCTAVQVSDGQLWLQGTRVRGPTAPTPPGLTTAARVWGSLFAYEASFDGGHVALDVVAGSAHVRDSEIRSASGLSSSTGLRVGSAEVHVTGSMVAGGAATNISQGLDVDGGSAVVWRSDITSSASGVASTAMWCAGGTVEVVASRLVASVAPNQGGFVAYDCAGDFVNNTVRLRDAPSASPEQVVAAQFGTTLPGQGMVASYNSLLHGRLQFHAAHPVSVQGDTGVGGNFLVEACFPYPGACGPLADLEPVNFCGPCGADSDCRPEAKCNLGRCELCTTFGPCMSEACGCQVGGPPRVVPCSAPADVGGCGWKTCDPETGTWGACTGRADSCYGLPMVPVAPGNLIREGMPLVGVWSGVDAVGADTFGNARSYEAVMGCDDGVSVCVSCADPDDPSTCGCYCPCDCGCDLNEPSCVCACGCEADAVCEGVVGGPHVGAHELAEALCAPGCAGRECGPDGCGGVCGDCTIGRACEADGRCRSPAVERVEVYPGAAAVPTTIGSTTGAADEAPTWTHYASAMWVSRSEVTVAQYADCVTEGACSAPAAPAAAPAWGQCNWGVKTFEDHPVNCVSWEQAANFCAWTGMRLPTEAEWEAVARGLSAPGYGLREYPWGDAPATCSLAHMAQGGGSAGYGCGNAGMTAAACSVPAGETPEGLCDVAGNVAEWTQLPYVAYPPSGASGVDDATRVVRGGGLADGSAALRGAARAARDAASGYVDVGFRCVHD